MRRNITLLFIIKAAKWFMLYIPIIFLFYKENGFDTSELFILHAIYSAVIAVLEVPSGYAADVWGRKPALVLGTLFGALGFLAYSFSFSLLGFAIAEILLGIGQSMISGADSAMLYDSLLVEKKEKKYVKLEGSIAAIGNFSEAIAALLVSVLAFTVIRNYYYLQTSIALLAFLSALFLKEPSLHNIRKKPGIKDIIGIIKYTFKLNKKLRDFVLLSSLIGFSSLTMAWFVQPVLYEIGLKNEYFGYSALILNLIVALGSVLAYKINNAFRLKGILLFTILPLTLGFVLVGLNLNFYAFIPLVVFYFVRGMAHPSLKNYINKYTSSEIRATVFSLRSLIIRVLFVSMGPMLGVLTDTISLKLALILCGTLVLIPSLVLFFIIILIRD